VVGREGEKEGKRGLRKRGKGERVLVRECKKKKREKEEEERRQTEREKRERYNERKYTVGVGREEKK